MRLESTGPIPQGRSEFMVRCGCALSVRVKLTGTQAGRFVVGLRSECYTSLALPTVTAHTAVGIGHVQQAADGAIGRIRVPTVGRPVYTGGMLVLNTIG